MNRPLSSGLTPFLPLSRRAFLGASVAALALPAASAAQTAPAFDFDSLIAAAQAAAAEPFRPPARLSGAIAGLSYDDYRKIQFRPDRAHWADQDSAWHVHGFHLGWLFDAPIALYDVSEGTAQPIGFSPRDFIYHGTVGDRFDPDAPLPGVAGFRLNGPLNQPDRFDEIVSFLGASYFRAVGAGNRYGISARGLALNTAGPVAEEFPKFTAFYLARDPATPETVTIYARLDSASVTGAYRFVLRGGQVTEMDVTAHLFFRQDVVEIGIAPLTSMFLFAGINRGRFDDYRPRVHDSDGLGIVQANGDIIWRPLNNPTRLANAYFAQSDLQSFGLYQRSRDFDEYRDAYARYDLRPSLEVIPKGDWGPGFVRLVEIPADLETYDNIVAFFVPEGPVPAGAVRRYDYRLRWGDLPPGGQRAPVLATTAGHGGTSGTQNAPDTRKFVIDFAAQGLPRAPEALQAVVNVSGGDLVFHAAEPIGHAGLWRLVIDVRAPAGAVVELTAHLAENGTVMTEIWANQWVVDHA